MRPRRAASRAPASAVASQGWATAVGTGARPAAQGEQLLVLTAPGIEWMHSWAFRSGILPGERENSIRQRSAPGPRRVRASASRRQENHMGAHVLPPSAGDAPIYGRGKVADVISGDGFGVRATQRATGTKAPRGRLM